MTKQTEGTKMGSYSVRILFAGEWVNVGGSVRISREEAIVQAAHMRANGDDVRVWHAVEGWVR